MFGLSKTANRFLVGSLAVLAFGALFFVVLAIRFFSISATNGNDGYEFGLKHDAEECIDEAVNRHTVTIDPTRQLGESEFVDGCIRIAKSNAEFCHNVPAFSVLNQAPIVAWADSKCNEKGFSDGGCKYVYLKVVAQCEMRKDKESHIEQ